MSPKQHTDSQCQHISPKGNRCHMLIDQHHRPANGANHPTLCAYHANRLQSTVPPVDPELLAADLLSEIDDFSTADSVNFFLGNLLKQLARKRIARRDAIALAYISQLLLNSLPALKKEVEAVEKAESKQEHERYVARLLRRNEELAALRNLQPKVSAAAHIAVNPAPSAHNT